MKYIPIFVLILFLSFQVFAQFEKRKMGTGMNLSGAFRNNPKGKKVTTDWNNTIAPNIGFEIFIRKNQSIMVEINSGSTHNKRVLNDSHNMGQQLALNCSIMDLD
jgi:hypothetical protein